MAKTPAECEVIIAEVEKHFNKTIKRCSSATAGLSVSQPDRLLNGVAHLLCNKVNYPIVRGLIAANFEIEIPARFEKLKVDVSSYMYAAGSAPRFKPVGQAHVSKDEAKRQEAYLKVGEENTDIIRLMKEKQDFVSWAQAYRVNTVGGFVGLSRSVAKTTAEQRADWTPEQRAAAEQQEAVYAAVLDGGKAACNTLMKASNVMEASAGIMAKLQAKRAEMEARKNGEKKPAPTLVVTIDEVKVTPPVKKAKVSKKKGKTPAVVANEQIVTTTDEEPEYANLNGTPAVEDALVAMYEDVQVPAWDADEGMM